MRRIVTLALLVLHFGLWAQDRPFWSEIRAFKATDSLHAPPRNAIVFVGSSSFKLWKDLAQYFPGHTVINRGFGGSSLPHVIDYADEIVIPYKPRQVVIYCGENDFMSDTITSAIVVDRFKTLFNLLRKEIPRAHITFISMKPSPSRRHRLDEMAEANQAIMAFLSREPRASFVDIWDAMLDEEGEPREELFLKDLLHMNEKGYAIWQQALKPHLR